MNAEGRALYYTAVIREPLAQPATLPLLASLAVRDQLAQRYGVDCQIKWPNDLLLNGKKIVGILCEGVSYGYQQQEFKGDELVNVEDDDYTNDGAKDDYVDDDYTEDDDK